MNTSSDRQWMMPENPSRPALRLAQDYVADGQIDEPTDLEMESLDLKINESLSSMKLNPERRRHRRFFLESRDLTLQRWDGRSDGGEVLGKILDLSAGGVRLKTTQSGIRVDQQIRVRLELPDNGGICPFVDMSSGSAKPKREWIGWLAVARVRTVGTHTEVAGRLVDMEEMDRGMLGLYLSTQPLAA